MRIYWKSLFVGFFLVISTTGCSTPAVHFKKEKEHLTIYVEPSKIFGIPYGGSLPAGSYSMEIAGDKASMDTKQDLKLIDLNLSKIGE